MGREDEVVRIKGIAASVASKARTLLIVATGTMVAAEISTVVTWRWQ